MPYSPRVKELAYLIDPDAWISYSGKDPAVKRAIDRRRETSLSYGVICVLHGVTPDQIRSHFLYVKPEPIMSPVVCKPGVSTMTPMKLSMMLHFYAIREAFPGKSRTSPAYAQFAHELLTEGLTERPSKEEQERYPGWAYRSTDKGRVFVKALLATPLPVQAKPSWVMPTNGDDGDTL